MAGLGVVPIVNSAPKVAFYRVPTVTSGALYLMPYPVDRMAFRRLSEVGVHLVISLLEAPEAKDLGLAKERDFCAAEGMDFHTMPIADFMLPNRRDYAELIRKICTDLGAGRHVAVHCHAGIGRSGMVVSGVLMALGATAQQALVQASEARGIEVPDTAEQRAFIESFEPFPKK